MADVDQRDLFRETTKKDVFLSVTVTRRLGQV